MVINFYQPYVQFGSIQFLDGKKNQTALTFDLFVPIWQQDLEDLIFADLRLNDYCGTSSFVGSMNLGYRHLFVDSKQLLGVYSAFDRKRTVVGNYFQQVTLGGEFWFTNWFAGMNIYLPVGGTAKVFGEQHRIDSYGYDNYRDIWLTKSYFSEKAMAGVDVTVGYEFKAGLLGYLGGYYFGANDVAAICGPKARLTYEWNLDNTSGIDQVGLEVGVQKDRSRGTFWYVGANVRLGWASMSKSLLPGVARHMLDPVRRNADVVVHVTTNITREKFIIMTVRNQRELSQALTRDDLDFIDIQHRFAQAF